MLTAQSEITYNHPPAVLASRLSAYLKVHAGKWAISIDEEVPYKLCYEGNVDPSSPYSIDIESDEKEMLERVLIRLSKALAKNKIHHQITLYEFKSGSDIAVFRYPE